MKRLVQTLFPQTLSLPLMLSGCLLSGSLFAAEDIAAPAPRNAEGRILLDAQGDDENGLWVVRFGAGGSMFDVDSFPFKPWSKGLFDARQKHDLEPHARCKASGAIRQFLTPYGVEILEVEEFQQLYIFDIGGPHTFRTVYLDGRSHPADLAPSNYGHSIGWWEGDTLVIDTTGYNTDFWFERMGIPYTEAAHTVEYLTRIDADTIDYRFVLHDSLAYDGPVEGSLTLDWRGGEELFEYVCQQSNYANDLMVTDDLNAHGTSSPITP